ncbi:MAG: endonuclease MutS2 [Calditrichaeota bacterium]|nr:MAG: endonuclease MutS2 [Calditrichota bacterium]
MSRESEKNPMNTHDTVSLQQLEFSHILEALSSHISTPYGQEILEKATFSQDEEIVSRWLAEVEQMKGVLEAGYHPPLSGFTNILPLLQKMQPEEAFLEATQLLEIKNNLLGFGELHRFFKERQEEVPLLYAYARGIHYHRKIIKQIEGSIDDSGEIFDNASPELRKIRVKIRSLLSQQRKVLTEVQKRYSEFSREEIVTLRDGRLVLGILPSFVNRVNGVVHGTSSSGGTVFVEPMETLKISNQVQNLKIEERVEIIKILKFLTSLLREIREDVLFGIHNLTQLDLIHARARLAIQMRASKPRLTTDTRVNIKDGRHPILLLKHGYENVVPLDVTLGESFHTLIITGPNAGGKTVALKTIGLLLLMTQMGLLIPASPDSEIPLLPKILVDIGDRQSLEQDLSTFSAHIVRLRNILSMADKESLVLLDEIGTGTDPREGAALAIAILSHLVKKKILTVATTHHGELKAFAHHQPGVENASMEFDLNTLQPTYRLRIGIPGSSYAFAIARRYGLPESILKAAQKYVGKEKDRLEEVILELERRIQDLEKKQAELSVKLSEAEATRKLYQRELEQLKKKKTELQKQAAEEAEQILRNANALIERIVQELRETKADKSVIKAAREAVAEEREKLTELLTEPPEEKSTTALEAGDIVWIESLGEKGEVLSVNPEKQKVQVQVGNVKMTLNNSGLKKIPHEPMAPTVTHHYSGKKIDNLSSGVPPELDLRGMTCEDALEEVDRYLNEAIESGWSEVRIVHGKGSGVLRKCVNDYLSRDKRVLSKRLGKWGEGDTGVTVVQLNVS